MNELEALVASARALRLAGEPFVVATVVRVRGSAYRRPGARLVIGETGRFVGSISGGCLERDLVARGFFRTEHAATVVTYDQSASEDVREGFGVGCDGIVDVLLERGSRTPDATDPFLCFERTLATSRESVLVTVFGSTRPDVQIGARLLAHGGDRVVSPGFGVIPPFVQRIVNDLVASGGVGSNADRSRGPVEQDGLSVLIERIQPVAELFVVGTGHDAIPMVAVARAAGLRVTVWDHEDRLASRERFGALARVGSGSMQALAALVAAAPRAAVIVMGHHAERDGQALRAILPCKPAYLGVLGPRVRTLRLLAEVGADPSAIDRLHAPAGLRLGGEAPEEVALAIVAEAQLVLSAAAGGHHKDHRGPIHD